MCGIAGTLAFDGRPADTQVLAGMAGALRHRGPDGEGLHRDGSLGLAHRRLSILDLEGGAQPMTSGDGGAWIVFNGEIYNFVELRAALRERGHRLRTRSDTEVILHLYEDHGDDCVLHLRGMFAFALWDPARRRLLLARDRVGIKPLYYYSDPRRLVFGSELKALLRHPAVPRQVDPSAVSEFLTYGYIPAPRTIFAGVRKLEAGHLLVAEAGRLAARRYWSLPEPGTPRPAAAWREELDATLEESVRLHMRSDVPVGALLSGGIDSSLVVALAAGAAAGPLHTFSVGFREAAHSELPHARAVSARYGTRHHEYVLDPGGMDELPRLVAHFDEPFGDASALACSKIAAVAARHVKVCLSGDGGDEAFAGYDAYRLARRLRRLDAVPLGLRRLLLSPIERRLPEWVRGKGLLRFATLPPADRYAEIMGGVDLGTRAWLLTEDFRRAAGLHHPYRALREAHAAAGTLSAGAFSGVGRLQRVDVATYLPDDILVKADRTSMLHSLELRVPLLDHKVLELAFRMPDAMKLARGPGKRVLRELAAPRLPAGVVARRKQGFGLPLSSWFRGDLAGLARDVFTDGRTRRRGILEPAGLDRLLASHRRGRRDLSGEIWLALVLELWFRECVDWSRAPAAAES